MNFEQRFNGDFRIIRILDRGPAAQENNLIAIPGRHGAYHRFKRRDAREISVDFELNSTSFADLQEKVVVLSELLDVDEPAPLSLPDEQGRVRFAIQNGEIDWEESHRKGRGTIYFLCPDPYSYSDVTLQNVTERPNVINDGTAETYPTFEIDVLEDITNLEIRNKSITDRLGANPAIVLGIPAQPDQELFVPEELVFHDSMQSTSTWQTASDVDNGYIAGEIAADSKGFYPVKFGEGIDPNAWQGPSLQKGVGTSLQDFRADILIECLNPKPEQIGMLAVYFRDANNNIVARIGFGDTWAFKAENFGHFQLGNYYTGPRIDAHADYAHGWNNFNGLIRVIRNGNVWTAYYAVIRPDGRHDWVHSRTIIIDTNGQYTAPIRTVQVAFRLWYGAERTNMHIKNIKLFKLNQKPQSTAVPFMARAGDKLTVDTKTSKILKNGEQALYLADLQSQMFPLAKGVNRLEIVPNDAVNVNAKFRKAYL